MVAVTVFEPAMTPNRLEQLDLSRADPGTLGEIDSEANDGDHQVVPPNGIISPLLALEMAHLCAIYPLYGDRLKFNSVSAGLSWWNAPRFRADRKTANVAPARMTEQQLTRTK
jgi:hypothetical protein